MLLKVLDENGFSEKYDFVYLPIDFARATNLGYAFINMLSHSDAEQMQWKLEGYCNWGLCSAKKCQVAWSTTQGTNHHIEHYRNSPIMHESVPDDCKPILFKNGKRAPAPAKKGSSAVTSVFLQ